MVEVMGQHLGYPHLQLTPPQRCCPVPILRSRGATLDVNSSKVREYYDESFLMLTYETLALQLQREAAEPPGDRVLLLVPSVLVPYPYGRYFCRPWTELSLLT